MRKIKKKIRKEFYKKEGIKNFILEASVKLNKSYHIPLCSYILTCKCSLKKVIDLVKGPWSSVHVKCWDPTRTLHGHFSAACDVQIPQLPAHAPGDHREGRCWGRSSHTLCLGLGSVGLTCQMGNGDSSPSHGHDFGADLPTPALTVLAPLCCPNKVQSLLSQVSQPVGVRDGLAERHKRANPVSTGVGHVNKGDLPPLSISPVVAWTGKEELLSSYPHAHQCLEHVEELALWS